MGTSQSSRGPGKGSPLVPSWANDPNQPLPSPEPRRLYLFRRSLGRFIKNKDGSALQSALGHYARKGTGGSSTAIRKMGAFTQAGAHLYNFLSGISQIGLPSEKSININDLAGQPFDIVIALIANALTPDNGDADKIRAAINHALVEALDGIQTFDPNSISDEIIVTTMIEFLSESIFIQIAMDGGRAWNNAESPFEAITAENDIRELITVIVDKHMAPKMEERARTLSYDEILQLEKQVIADVWSEWEGHK